SIRRLLVLLDPALTERSTLVLDSLDDRRLLMLEVSLWTRRGVSLSVSECLQRLDANPTLRDEVRTLLELRRDCIDSVAPPPKLPFSCPLALHAPYTRDEILTALGHLTRSEQPDLREGVVHIRDIQTDVFFVTLQKTERDYSPSTMYQDYAI